MPEQLEDLWPDLTPAAIITPASILKTQAAVLSQKSKGLLQGEVESWTHENDVHHQLVVVVPALDNYRYTLIKLHHSLTIYPVFIDESPVPREQEDEWSNINRAYKLQDEDSFRNWLRTILAAPQTIRILQNLLAQATS
jgi:hypothetical protein